MVLQLIAKSADITLTFAADKVHFLVGPVTVVLGNNIGRRAILRFGGSIEIGLCITIRRCAVYRLMLLRL